MHSKKVDILLATYIGADFLEGPDFLRQQIDSLLAQTYSNFRILIRDDGSTPETLEILNEYQRQNPEKIEVIEDESQNLGCAQNFMRLMEHSSADYVCFADQDDIWHPDKVARSIRFLEELEEQHGTQTPLLMHHDYSIIDPQGDIRAASYDQKYKTQKSDSSIRRMLVRALVYGFSSTANRALVNKVLPFPDNVHFHDAYISAVAKMAGEIGYIPEPLSQHRIHDHNTSDGNNPFHSLSTKDFFITNIFNGHSLRCLRAIQKAPQRKISETCAFVEIFMARHGDELQEQERQMLVDFLKLKEAGFF